jgi:hypothetical protein
VYKHSSRYQGRALNHWRYFFTNLRISLQLVQKNPAGPLGAPLEEELQERHVSKSYEKTRNTRMDDQNWRRERETQRAFLASEAPAPAENAKPPSAQARCHPIKH